MSKYGMPCVYYPTTVMVVDDNESFLEHIRFGLGLNGLCLTQSDPRSALEYAQRVTSKNRLFEAVLGVDKNSHHYSLISMELPLSCDISKIWHDIYRDGCYAEISVFLVDYEMPGMSGEEFCIALRKTLPNPVKIIMLTGEADDLMAIKLLNAGVIDRFLRKGQIGLGRMLKNVIAELQRRYFHDLTYPITLGLSLDKASILTDSNFQSVFFKVCDTVSAASYYLLDPSGSFLIVDQKAVPTWFLVRTLHELQEFAGQMADAGVRSELAEKIGNGEMIPYFPSSVAYVDSISQSFEDYLHPARKVSGDRGFAYAVTKNFEDFGYDRKRIMSLDDYNRRISMEDIHLMNHSYRG